MWQSLSISIRIWLSISILVFGYFVSMVVGYVLGLQTESRLFNVSESLVPAAKYSQFAVVSFKEQMRLYQDAVLSGEKVFVDSAVSKSYDFQKALKLIVAISGLEESKKGDAEKLIEEHAHYTRKANELYYAMSSVFEGMEDNPSLATEEQWNKNTASLMTARADSLLGQITQCANSFSRDLTIELAAISKVTRQQRILNAIVFISVVITAFTLMGIIISRSISRPLKKTFMLESAVEQSVDGIAVLDFDGYVQFGNHAWAAMHDYTIDDISGKHLSFFLGNDLTDNTFMSILVEVQKKGSAKCELNHRKKDGSAFPSTMTVNLLKEKTVKDSLMVIARDITEQKIHEMELRAAKEKAEEANEALQQSLIMLKRTQDHLVQSEKMVALGGLVAGVAHEINTPVGIGVTAASFLEDRTILFKEDFEKDALRRSDIEKYLKIAQETSAMILSNLLRAAELIKSFKQVAVDQSGEDRRIFNLKEYLNSVLLSLNPKYKRTGHSITLNCRDNMEINNYPGAFSQIITNLLMNSLIHGFDGIEKGKIDIDIEIRENNLIISYRDNGKGMESDHLKKIFDPFFTTKRSYGGTGLGMHIVFNLVTQQLRGKIECSSKIGEGVSFLIKIPVDEVVAGVV
ncbi:MAG: PAS domain-containing sensor histidine kinase [Proteobacteria bacterium]|nr:PAS domain-containing sensor histidine kinase [Pseudomonadota bacterium]